MDDVRNIIVKNINNKPIFIKDIASVVEGKQIRQGGVTKDGHGEVITGIVMMLRGGNGREVISEIEDKIAEINRSLPEGVSVEKSYNFV